MRLLTRVQRQGLLVRAAARRRRLRGAGQGLHRTLAGGLEEAATRRAQAAGPGAARRQLLDENQT